MSDRLIVYGGRPLVGEVRVSGAKNAALPELAASIMAKGPVRFTNLPHLLDVATMLQLLNELGAMVSLTADDGVTIDASNLTKQTVPYALVKAMRASILVLGPLLARYGEASVALPGGCAIGSRPIDLHLKGLKAMGAKVSVSEGYVHATVTGRLKGADIEMSQVTVTGTENIMMAAVLADGATRITNAAREPEVADLADFLNKLGAKIQGAGTRTIVIEGVQSLSGGEHRVLPDRIEAGTYLVGAAMTGGSLVMRDMPHVGMNSILYKLQEGGAHITTYDDDTVKLDMVGKSVQPVDVSTAPFPGFPTDMQAQFMAMNTVAKGASIVRENIFENRFMHVPELQRLGANITINGREAYCNGVDGLVGAPVVASDLRASACLVLAALVADGVTVVEGVNHMDRGYEYIESKLRCIGADIVRTTI